MKLAIAIALVVLWLFFPAAHAVRWCRRWRARREAATHECFLGEVRQSPFDDILGRGRNETPPRDAGVSFHFSCGFHKEVRSSTVCAQSSIDFLLP